MLLYACLDVKFIRFLKFSYCHVSIIIKIISEQLTFHNGVAVIKMRYVCPRYVVSEQSAATSCNVSQLPLLCSMLCVLHVLRLIMCVRDCLIGVLVFDLSESYEIAYCCRPSILCFYLR
jgi:hypothetical protein